MTTPSTRTPAAAGHFSLQIDGHRSTTHLKSVEGGMVKGTTAEDRHGGGPYVVKHLASLDNDPIKFEFGASGAAGILKWIQASWKQKYATRNGEIRHGDFNLDQYFVQEFTDAVLTEIAFPTLDGSSKDPLWIKCTMQPAGVTAEFRRQGKLPPDATEKQKLWSASCFRLCLDQIDGMQHTNKIEGFTIKQGVKKLYTGPDRYPTLTPTKLEFPNISGTMALAYADSLLAWYNRYAVEGRRDRDGQLSSGAIDFLSPDRKQTLFTINLYDIGIMQASIVPSSANAEAVKRVKFDLFVNRMELDIPTSAFELG
jgi:hypothetical protein